MTTTSRARRGLAAALAVLAVTGAAACGRDDTAAPPSRPRPAGDDPLRIDAELISSLEAFDACDDLLAYLRTEGAKVVGPYGFGSGGFEYRTMAGGAATAAAGAAREDADPAMSVPPAAPAPMQESAAEDSADHSATNVQEEGVDEPDLVKTDGKRLVAIANGQLRVVDLTGAEPRLASTVRIDDQPYLDGQLLLHGDRVLVLHQALEPMTAAVSPPMVERGGIRAPMPPMPRASRTAVTTVDISDPDAAHVTDRVSFDGDLVASRMVDGVARLVLRSAPPALPFLYPSGSDESTKVATEANRRLVAESTLDDWLPGFTLDSGSGSGSTDEAKEQRLTDCRDVSRPEVFSGIGMLTVATLDTEDPRPGPGATIVGAGDTVYASLGHLYVTSTAWSGSPSCPPNADCSGPANGTAPTTDIHAFDISDPVRTTYEASGRVKGTLLNSFSMSEHEGVLRVATTDPNLQESTVTVLRRSGAALAELGSVGGLGKNERIYAVRFLGDRGYVVTFRQTDPLYVLDLADPAAPKVAGELKIPGYSAYLHPVGDHRLIGIGQDASEQGRVQGTQVSLFDVADPANPKRLANAVLPQAHSEAEYDHHAFLWWARSNLAVIPVDDYASGRSGAAGFSVTDDGIVERGRIEAADGAPIRRTVVVGDRLLTLSDSGLQANDLGTLVRRSRLAF